MASQWEAEYRLRRADGSYAHVNARGFILRDEAGRPLRMIGSLMDVTDKKRVEEVNGQLVHASRLAVLGELRVHRARDQPAARRHPEQSDAAEILLAGDDPGRRAEGDLEDIVATTSGREK